jgi:hypothetical protein
MAFDRKDPKRQKKIIRLSEYIFGQAWLCAHECGASMVLAGGVLRAQCSSSLFRFMVYSHALKRAMDGEFLPLRGAASSKFGEVISILRRERQRNRTPNRFLSSRP